MYRQLFALFVVHLGILASVPAAIARAGHPQPHDGRTRSSVFSSQSSSWRNSVGIHTTRNPVRPDGVTGWHPRKVDDRTLATVNVLQPGRLLVVTHEDFYDHTRQALIPVLAKLADMDSPSDRQSLAHEASMYERLDGTGITPQFVGHVVNEDGSAIGFLIEYIPQDENERLNRQAMQACLEVLRHLHGQGLAHGDPHDGNCLLRVDRTAVLIDFELAQEAAPAGELVRDERIMDRCIRAIPSVADINNQL